MSRRDATVLHEFARPPVIETILGVHFKPIRELTIAHLGIFWRSLGSEDWPNLRELGAITPQIERFDRSPTAPMRFVLKELEQPEMRLRFGNDAENKVVQVQGNLLQTHWVRRPDTAYPRYTSSTKPEFLAIWSRFVDFLRAERFEAPEPSQWEVTYINRIPAGKGQLWQTPADWPTLFNGVLVPPVCPDGVIESARASYHYRLTGDQGRLHVEVRHKLGEDQEPESLDLILTARGPIATAASLEKASDGPTIRTAIESGLDTGRRAIVNGFTAFGSKRALEFWGHKEENADA